MTFYVPGTTGLVWCFLFYILIYSTPKDHPRSVVSSLITHLMTTLRISKAELEYLSFNTASRGEDGLTVPWLAMLRSPAVHVLWFTHLCSAFGFYLLAINLTLFIREALGFRVTDVSVNTLITACFSVKPRTHLSQNHCNYANNNLTIT